MFNLTLVSSNGKVIEDKLAYHQRKIDTVQKRSTLHNKHHPYTVDGLSKVIVPNRDCTPFITKKGREIVGKDLLSRQQYETMPFTSEHRAGIVKKIIERNESGLTIFTGSDIIKYDDYIELMKGKDIKVRLVVNSGDTVVQKKIDGVQASLKRLIKTYDRLEKYGIDVSFVHCIPNNLPRDLFEISKDILGERRIRIASFELKGESFDSLKNI